jgi:hypothetical protein
MAAPSANSAWGVDFGNMTYANTPCETTPAKMHNGKYTYPGLVTSEGTDIDASIQQVSQGQVAILSSIQSRYRAMAAWRRCYSQGDTWIVTTYRFANGKLIKAFLQLHKLHTPIRP